MDVVPDPAADGNAVHPVGELDLGGKIRIRILLPLVQRIGGLPVPAGAVQMKEASDIGPVFLGQITVDDDSGVLLEIDRQDLFRPSHERNQGEGAQQQTFFQHIHPDIHLD